MGCKGPSGLEDDRKFLADPLDFSGERSGAAAINAQREAQDKSNALLKWMFNTQRKDLEPWRLAGADALGDMQNEDLYKRFTAADFEKDPGYDFRMKEATKAIERSAAAKGGLNSGATMKALNRFTQDYASNEYDKARQRFIDDRNQNFNKFASLAGLGQVGTGQGVQATGQYGQQMSENALNMGNAIANQQMQQQQNKQSAAAAGVGLLAAFSDKRLKKNISDVSESDLKELSESITPKRFEYKDPAHGEGEIVGVMAQDLEKSKLGREIVEEDEQGRKYVDGRKLSSLFLASLAKRKAG